MKFLLKIILCPDSSYGRFLVNYHNQLNSQAPDPRFFEGLIIETGPKVYLLVSPDLTKTVNEVRARVANSGVTGV